MLVIGSKVRANRSLFNFSCSGAIVKEGEEGTVVGFDNYLSSDSVAMSGNVAMTIKVTMNGRHGEPVSSASHYWDEITNNPVDEQKAMELLVDLFHKSGALYITYVHGIEDKDYVLTVMPSEEYNRREDVLEQEKKSTEVPVKELTNVQLWDIYCKVNNNTAITSFRLFAAMQLAYKLGQTGETL